MVAAHRGLTVSIAFSIGCLYNEPMSVDSTSKLYKHYRGSNVDALLVAQEWDCSVAVFSALKYLQRHGKKETETAYSDMLKAVWYLVYETASTMFPHEYRLIIADQTVDSIRNLCSSCSYQTRIAEGQDSSDSQSLFDSPCPEESGLLDESVPSSQTASVRIGQE